MMKKKNNRYYKGLIGLVVAGMLLSTTGCGVLEKEESKEFIVESLLDEMGLEDVDYEDLKNLGLEDIDLKDLEKLQDLDLEQLQDLDSEQLQDLNSDDINLEYGIEDNTLLWNNQEYDIIEVDGGNRSGNRECNVAVDIGFGERVYWGLTNEHGQLVYVLADEIILQDDDVEAVNKDGRYYDDEAKVPGTEAKDLDQGHVIADSMGGVSNAYNITPQNATLNRHGNQAYMEKVIRDAGGCSEFVAVITYPDYETQTPSSYRYEYILRGNTIVDEFDNVDPEK